MLPNPFPNFISFQSLDNSSIQTYSLPLEEEAYLKTLKVEKRRRDYWLGRVCAHQALIELGVSDQPILRKKNRAPIWPKTIVGSITHSGLWAAAAVAKEENVRGIGIDIEELNRSINIDIQRHVCTLEEREWLARYPSDQLETYLKVIFSAKESIFKCFHPFSGIYLNFHDARVSLNQESSCFEFTLLKSCGPGFEVGFQYRGKYEMVQEMIFTSLWIPA